MPKSLRQARVSAVPTASGHRKSTKVVRDESLFAVPLRIIQWTTEAGFNETLAGMLGSFYHERVKSRVMTFEYNLWQEFSDELEVNRLREMFVEGLNDYVDTFLHEDVKKAYDYEMAAWLRIDNPKQVLPPHMHSHAQIVATYYCQVDVAQQKLVDTGYGMHVREGDLVVMDTQPVFPLRFQKENSTYSVSPRVGMMVLMPGRMMHWVNPVSAGDARICVANNFVFSEKDSVGVPCSF